MYRIFASVVLFAICLTGTNSNAAEREGIAWSESLTVAWNQMKQQKRPLLLYVTADNCLFCEKMHAEVWNHQGVVSDIRKRFVAAEINVEKSPLLAQKLGVEIFPTTVIIAPNAKVLGLMPGYANVQEMRRNLAKASQSWQQSVNPSTAQSTPVSTEGPTRTAQLTDEPNAPQESGDPKPPSLSREAKKPRLRPRQ